MSEPAGYVDLQVNGYGGVDFNSDDLTPESLDHACQKLQSDGVAAILATIITDSLPVMQRRLANLAHFREQSPLAKRMIPGLHIEGPFINPADGYRGAHPADAVRPADEDTMRRLLDSAAGLTRLVTLAPEQDADTRVTRLLASAGIKISAGHTNATLDQFRATLDAGLTLFTHLGNGCPMQMHRHDNIIHRVLHLSDRITPTLIADGVHLPFFVLANFIRFFGIDRSLLVTDAIAPAGLGPGRYTLARWEVQIGPEMVARSPDGSHFIGSAITMKQSAANLREKLGLGEDAVTRLTAANAARILGLVS